MFYKTEIKDYIRVPPNLFGLPRNQAIVRQIKAEYEGYISKQIGIVIDVTEVKEVHDGIIIPGDGASYYDVVFELLVFKPEMQEVVLGSIKDITDFGAFISFGPMEGMIHISQTMDDFVSFSKDKALAGKESKRVLKVGDRCMARIVAVSFKDIANPKFGLTMRQPGLGKLDWINEEKKNEEQKKTEETPMKKKSMKKKGKK